MPPVDPIFASKASNLEKTLNLEDIHLTLSATSGPVHILKGINFNAEAGETIAIVGASGSGKSSMIAIAAGLEQPSSGKAFLLNQCLNDRSEDDLAKLRCGRVSMIFQSFHLLPTMTAFDNVRAPLEIARLDHINERAQSTLESVGLSDRLDHYPGQLSGGERQRVAIARALASDPEIVFADEPTGNLDSTTGAGVADMLFDIAERHGTTLILVTHDQDLAKRAQRIVTMRDGTIV